MAGCVNVPAIAGTAAAVASKPVEVKVVVVTMFEIGADSGHWVSYWTQGQGNFHGAAPKVIDPS